MFDANRLFMILMVYFISYGILLWFRPGIIFDPSKTGLRPFGVGYKNTTILPLWLVSILLAIFFLFCGLVFYSPEVQYRLYKLTKNRTITLGHFRRTTRR